jgi:hypothetical protein
MSASTSDAAVKAAAIVTTVFSSAWILMLAVGAVTPLALGYGAALLSILAIRVVGMAWKGWWPRDLSSKKEEEQ